jgi:alkylation response protein AidB-like acyl-CoA dehydrogenase
VCDELSLRQVTGIDPELGLVQVSGEAEVTDRVPFEWATATADGQVALGHELVGAARRMLELARTHALDRVQFGVPIASFQAVRHRLAETLVAVETADAVLDAAWLDGAPDAAAMAKAVAGRSARTAARHCQQVLAGIGFTTEHDLHRYVRRVLVLEQLLGATRSLTTELGAEVLRSGTLPALLPL